MLVAKSELLWVFEIIARNVLLLRPPAAHNVNGSTDMATRAVREESRRGERRNGAKTNSFWSKLKFYCCDTSYEGRGRGPDSRRIVSGPVERWACVWLRRFQQWAWQNEWAGSSTPEQAGFRLGEGRLQCRSLEDNVENSAEEEGLACEISEGKLKTLFRAIAVLIVKIL